MLRNDSQSTFLKTTQSQTKRCAQTGQNTLTRGKMKSWMKKQMEQRKLKWAVAFIRKAITWKCVSRSDLEVPQTRPPSRDGGLCTYKSCKPHCFLIQGCYKPLVLLDRNHCVWRKPWGNHPRGFLSYCLMCVKCPIQNSAIHRALVP